MKNIEKYLKSFGDYLTKEQEELIKNSLGYKKAELADSIENFKTEIKNIIITENMNKIKKFITNIKLNWNIHRFFRNKFHKKIKYKLTSWKPLESSTVFKMFLKSLVADAKNNPEKLYEMKEVWDKEWDKLLKDISVETKPKIVKSNPPKINKLTKKVMDLINKYKKKTLRLICKIKGCDIIEEANYLNSMLDLLSEYNYQCIRCGARENNGFKITDYSIIWK